MGKKNASYIMGVLFMDFLILFWNLIKKKAPDII